MTNFACLTQSTVSLLVLLQRFRLKDKRTITIKEQMEINTENLASNSEHWASIDGYRNYEISWWGRVRNRNTARILKPQTSTPGYLMVRLSKNGKSLIHYIHQLVAREWVGNPEEKRCVDHIDGSRTNNHWENLRYATHSENSRNKKRRSDGTSVYKGVSYYKPTGKWKASIGISGKENYLGYFASEREAAESYNAAALEHFGVFAKINIFED